MDKETIESFLRRLNMDDSIIAFKKQDIDLNLLQEMSEEDLKDTVKEMNLTIGKQKKIQLEIRKLKSRKDTGLESSSSLLRSEKVDAKSLMATSEKYNASSSVVTKEADNVTSPMVSSEKDDASKSIESWKDKEIRIVLIGKTGSGKSATGNTILGRKCFKSTVSGSSVTSQCSQTSDVRFNHKILIIDTPGIFDTKKSNKEIQKEILKCISISSPGPHAFILVLNIARHTEEEEKSVQHFVDAFGKNIFHYFIILFTRKDDLDEENITLDDHIKSVPSSLKSFIENCGRRVIAFNNRLKGDERDGQVRELLSMIFKNVEKNNGECYRNEMYIEAEKLLQQREAEIRQQAKMERDKEIQVMKETFEKKFAKEAEKHKTKTTEEFQKWQEEFTIKQEEERKAKEEQLERKLKEKYEKARDVVIEEVVEEKSILGTLWNGAKLILPGFFTSYF